MEPGAVRSEDRKAWRVVVVAQPTAANRHVLGSLAGLCEVEKLIIATPSPARRTPGLVWERLRTAPGETLGKPGREKVLGRLESRLDREVAERLPQPGFSFSGAETMSAADLNGDVGAAMLTELKPDLMILSGAPLLKPRIFEIPTLGTVNLHWGIAPDYRGDQSILTALRRRDYSAIGVTLHRVDAGADTGPVLAQGRPSLEPGDTIADVWAHTAEVAATMLAEFLVLLGSGPVPGQPKPGSGVLVRGRDRRVWHHLQYAVDRGVLRHRPPHAEEEITRYW